MMADQSVKGRVRTLKGHATNIIQTAMDPVRVFITTFPSPIAREATASFVSYRPSARPDFTAHHSSATDSTKAGAAKVVTAGRGLNSIDQQTVARNVEAGRSLARRQLVAF